MFLAGACFTRYDVLCGPHNVVAMTTSDVTVKKSNGLLSGGGTGLSLLMEG